MIVIEAKNSLVSITDDISAVNWLVVHLQFFIVFIPKILKIFLLLNLAVIFIHAEVGDERFDILLANFPCQFTNTFYD